MLRRNLWSAPVILLSLLVGSLQAATFGVGNCNPKLKNFSTIQAAVSTVASGSTIQICPGTYFEQVTINQPLTLQGVTFNNSNRVVIALSPNATLSPNVASLLGIPPSSVSQFLYAQVLVENVAPTGPVNITGITVDGAGGNRNCSGTDGLVGIFYSVNTTGTVNEVATRNQQHCGFGYGIWGENGPGAPQAFTVENSSVENSDDNAIVIGSNQSPSSINATIEGNFINLTNKASVFSVGVRGYAAGGTISGNLITGGRDAVLITDTVAQPTCCAMTVSSNTMADIGLGTTGYAVQMGYGSVAQSNSISNVYTGFVISSGAATLQANTLMNIPIAGADFGCQSPITVIGNVLNDVRDAYYHAPQAFTVVNLVNVDLIEASACF